MAQLFQDYFTFWCLIYRTQYYNKTSEVCHYLCFENRITIDMFIYL